MFDPSSLEIHMMLNPDLEDAILDSSAVLSSADVLSSVICLKELFVCDKEHRSRCSSFTPTNVIVHIIDRAFVSDSQLDLP